MIELAIKNAPNCNFIKGDIRNLDTNIKYDAVIASFCIVHLSNNEMVTFIKKLSLLLNNRGCLYLSFIEGDKNGFIKPGFFDDKIYFNFFKRESIIKEKDMHKKIITIIIAILVTSFLVVPAMAKGKSEQAGKSNVGHLYLYQKDSSNTNDNGDWAIVEGGMWGKMKYNMSGPTFDFVFNGHRLPIGQEYSLIYYPDDYPANGLICLGKGTVTGCGEGGCVGDESGGGNIHIEGSAPVTVDLPIEGDENYQLDEDDNQVGGAKIFLVPLDYVDCEGAKMWAWPGDDANLYEGALITFDYTGEE